MEKANIAVLGSGGFGLSLAVMMDKMGHDVTVWSKFKSELDDIRRDGENKAKLPGVKISESIKLTDDISCVTGKDLVILGIPVNFVRSVAIGMPTTVVVASEIPEEADYVQSVMSSSTLRIYINDDVVGCEMGGALKNIIALCAGICDGMGYGDNTKAALMTRGMSEITRLGMALGGKRETFAGLSGVGDLIVTCTSMHSRNRRAGILIGKGTDPAEAVKQVGTVEGYFCTKAAYEIAQKNNICMPITEQCYNVLYNGADPHDAIKCLMGRPKKHETEPNLFL